MDKKTLQIAEQVGAFLIPVLQAAVDSRFLENIKTFSASIDSLSDRMAGLRIDHEKFMAAFASSVEATEHKIGSLAAEQGKLGEFVSNLPTVEELKALSEELSSSVRALGTPMDAIKADAAFAVKAVADLNQQLSAVSGQASNLVTTLSGRVDRLSAEVGAAQDALDTHARQTSRSVEALGVHIEGIRQSVPSAEGIAKLVQVPVPAVPSAEDVAKLVHVPTAGEVAKLVPLPVVPSAEDVASMVSREVVAAVQHIRTTIDRHVTASIADQVSKIEPAKVDVDALVGTLQFHIDAELDQVVPALKRSLQANISDEVSKAVAAIPAPKDGAAGVLPTIENYVEGRVYERGAAVFALGGTWQALAPTKTPPAPDSADWRAVAVGVAGVDTELSPDLRSVGLAVRLSDGTTVSREVLVPSLMYQGVFSEERTYNPMDVTTHAGSMWVTAAGAEAGEVPGKSAAWTLCVKRGVDGRSAKEIVNTVTESAGYSGDYEEGKLYRKDSIVFYAGSVWLSKQATKDRPPYMSNLDQNEHWLRVR